MTLTEPSWLPGCKANIAKLPNGKLCSENHCLDSQTYNHAVCNCDPPFQNGCGSPRTKGCCSYSATSPVPVFLSDGSTCYCCCGCFSNDTAVAVSATESREIATFLLGDPVWVAMDVDLSTWASIPVQFSSGTGPESQSTMIRITFGDDEHVYASRNQLFMVAGHRLKRASTLVPGQDQLTRPDGDLVPIHDLAAGMYHKGVHHIATGDEPATDPNGHLLIANGVIGGDYSLQIANLEAAAPDLLVDGYADLPEFGTKEYLERYGHLLGDSYRAHPADQAMRQVEDGAFEQYGVTERPAIPRDAAPLVTHQQATDIQRNTSQSPIHSGAGLDLTKYLFKLFKGFYPQVVFYLDEDNELPNVYAFHQYGMPHVVVNGGFVRTDIVQFELVAYAIAQALGHLSGGKPESKRGFTCTGAADYAALLAIFPWVWFGAYARPYIDAAITQVAALFDAIDPDHRHGRPGDTCVHISIECRLEAIHAAASTRSLPECAGGPPAPALAVIGATGGIGPDGAYVTVQFDQPVDLTTASRPGSYDFTPVVPATAASVAPDATEVSIFADLAVGVEYTVRAVEVLSATGHPVIPSRSRATFTITEAPVPLR